MDDEWENAPSNADIWDLRFHWGIEEARIWNDISNLKYRLSPMQVYCRVSGEKLA